VKVEGTCRKVEVERKDPVGINSSFEESLEEAAYGMSMEVVEIWQEKN